MNRFAEAIHFSAAITRTKYNIWQHSQYILFLWSAPNEFCLYFGIFTRYYLRCGGGNRNISCSKPLISRRESFPVPMFQFQFERKDSVFFMFSDPFERKEKLSVFIFRVHSEKPFFVPFIFLLKNTENWNQLVSQIF